MRRVSISDPQAVLCTFTTHHPDTGQPANADSAPTLAFVEYNSTLTLTPYTDIAVLNPATGVYGIRLDGESLSANFVPGQPVGIVVTVTVGGVTQKIPFDLLLVPPARGGAVVSDGGNTPSSFRARIHWDGSAAVDTATHSLVGSLVAFVDGQVARITGCTRIDSTDVTLVVEPALPATPSTLFWVITI